MLYKYLKSYEEIVEIYLYFGKDNHPKSEEFLNEAEKLDTKLLPNPLNIF